MTRREATIVSAYTGYFIGELDDLYKYLSDLIGRPIYTHEIPAVLDEYHGKIRQDFVTLDVEQKGGEVMREIKFRGKRGDNNDWSYGELSHGVFSGNSFVDGLIITETVAQYTGLEDKNGAEIYEGDILRNVDNPFVDKLPFKVVWNDYYGAWFWLTLEDEDVTDHFYQSIASDCEVIGNITDNPELMEEEK